jgi:polyvinyl alcohol dehydrogenase (cytochrome)
MGRMVTISLAASLLSLALAQTVWAQPPAVGRGGAPAGPNGEALFKAHCAMCHDPALDRTPSKTDLARNFPEYIKRALTSGVMQPMAVGLSDAEENAITQYLTGREPRPVGDITKEDANRCPAGSKFNPNGPRWNGWSPDVTMTRYQPNGGIAAAEVPKLKIKWAFAMEGGRYGQPTPYGNRLFVGSSSGRFYGLDVKTGCVAWSFTSDVGIRTAPAVAKDAKAPSGYAVMFGDYNKIVYAADAGSGAILWKLKVEEHPRGMLTGGFVTANGVLYVPLSTFEEAGATVAAYQCCSARGNLVAIDVATGQQLWKTYMIQTTPHPTRMNSIGVQRFGPAGAAIWSTPTVDTKRGLVYVATGDSFTDEGDDGISDSVVALDLKTGKIRWKNQVTLGDNYINGCAPGRATNPVNCPDKIGPDDDFGSSPILTHVGGKDVLVAGQKAGVVHAFDPDTGKVLWQQKVSAGSALGGIEWGMAADGTRVYAAAADRQGGLFALDLLTGKPAWSVKIDDKPQCGWKTNRCAGGYSAPPSIIPGVVFSGAQDGHLRAFDAKTGAKLWDFDTAGQTYDTVNGVKGQIGGPLDGSGPSIAGGVLYTMSGYNGSGGGGWSNNVLLAFSVDGK